MHLRSASLRTQLITLVCLVTLIPFAAGQWLSYRQTAAVIRENMDEQTRLNLQQMEKTLDATLASYEDLLYQIYTNDTVVELVNKLAAGEDVALSRNQLRREIQEKVFAKPYLGAITVLFEDGSYSTYDKLLASATSSTWLDGWDSEEMYRQVASTNTTHYFPSAYAITLMDQPHYLFHIAHRVIDWRHVENRNAIVILSVEETLLSDNLSVNLVRSGKTRKASETPYSVLVRAFSGLRRYWQCRAERSGEELWAFSLRIVFQARIPAIRMSFPFQQLWAPLRAAQDSRTGKWQE